MGRRIAHPLESPPAWMSSRRIETCRSKVGYSTMRQADSARTVFGKRAPKEAVGLGVYRCEACGLFHMGHRLPPLQLQLPEQLSESKSGGDA